MDVEWEKDPRAATVFSGSYLAYAACYLARNNAAVAKVPLLAIVGMSTLTLWGFGPDVAATKALGIMDATFLMAYTLGSFLIPAFLDLDRRNPWNVVWASLVVTGVSQLGMYCAWMLLASGFDANHFVLALSFCLLNGAAQSILYPSCKSILADIFGADGAILGSWNTCYYLGGIASTLLAAALCDSFGWGAAFCGPGVALVALGTAGLAVTAASQEGSKPPVEVAGAAVDSEEGTFLEATGARMAQLLAPSGLQLRVVAAQYFAVKLVRYAFGLWLPLLLAAGRGGEIGASLLVEVGGAAALFDLGSMAGSLALGAFSKNAGPSSLPKLVLGTTSLLALMLSVVPVLLGDSSSGPSLGALLLLLNLGIVTGGAETLLGSISPIYYSQRDGQVSVASAVASVNGYGSLGTVAAALALPFLSDGSPSNLPTAFGELSPLAWGAVLAALYQVALEQFEKKPDQVIGVDARRSQRSLKRDVAVRNR